MIDTLIKNGLNIAIVAKNEKTNETETYEPNPLSFYNLCLKRHILTAGQFRLNIRVCMRLGRVVVIEEITSVTKSTLVSLIGF